MITLDTVAEFGWGWNKDFFLETPRGNYIWSNPKYPDGDNTIIPFEGDDRDFCKAHQIPYLSNKGTHSIRSYCGEDVKLPEKKKS